MKKLIVFCLVILSWIPSFLHAADVTLPTTISGAATYGPANTTGTNSAGTQITATGAATVKSGKFVINPGTNGFKVALGGALHCQLVPFFPSAPTVSPSPIVGTTGTVSIVAAQWYLGAATITYTWNKVSGPGAVSFSPNATNAAKTATATFTANGAYVVQVTATGADGSANSYPLSVTVNQTSITNVAPTSGPAAGGTSVTITGTILTGATSVTFGGTAATIVSNTATQIVATAPAHAAGAVNVVVTTPNGVATSTNGYTYNASPTITTLLPTSGPIAGGTSVTITGTTLTGATSVTFGGTTATIVSNSATQIVATTPAHTAGAVNVVVTIPNGTATKTNGYTYIAAPTITSLVPTSGFAAGGTSVTITGTNLTGATATFGGTSATIMSATATQMVVTTPAHVAGVVNVVVTTSGGSVTKTNGYTYLVAPVITSLTPTSGFVAGGGSVTITGTTLTGATSVTFGGTTATIVSNTATQIVATAPVHAAGVVNVVVTTPNGVATSTNGYTYYTAPTITSLSPTSGALAGGTSVTIVGTALAGATAVTFGGTTATIVSNSATQIVATAPAHTAGAVNVVVTTPYGVATSTNGYTYNNVPTVAFQAATSTITEGGIALDIPVVLSQSYTLPVTVNYALSGTATGGGDDYYLPNGTLTFAPGEISKALIFQVRDDVTVEPAETAIITLSAPTNSSLGTTKIHTVTIIDNDAITVRVAAGDAITFEDGSHFGSFVFTRSGSVAAALTANVTLSGTATKGVDYTDPTDSGSTIIFPVGVSSVTKSVIALQDTLYEIDETITATVVAGTGYAVGAPSVATVTIHDDDVVTIAASKPIAAEAATPVAGEFTLSRIGTAGSLTVTLAISGSATTSDYTRSWTGNTVIIPAGSSTVKLTITPVQDTLVESPETVIVSITPTTYTVGAAGNATVTITDDDVPTVSITATDAIAAEPGGDKATFTISRAVSATTPLTVNYQVTGTATSGLDYTALTGTATIPANATSTTVTLTALGDQITEPDETVILTLSSSPTYNIATAASATAVIKDCTISIVATDAIAMEPSGDNGIYTITRSFATAAAQTVQVVWGGSATLNTDFTTTPATTTTVTIPANATSTTVTLLPKADALVEGTESAVLSLVPTTTYAVGNSSSASVAITDATLTIAVDRSEITENPSQSAYVTITRTGYNGAALTLAFTVSGTAINVQDYSRSSLVSGSSILFPAGTSQVSGTFTTINDALIEGNETIIASIGPSSYGIITPSVTVTVQDDEFPTVSLEVVDAAAGEAGADKGVFTLSRTGPITNPLIVTLSRSGTATAVTDYTATPTSITGTGTITVTIPAGQESTPITITPVDDAISEPAETVILSVVSQATYLVGTAQAQIAITDNDTPQVTITATSPQAAEGGASGVFTVQRIGNPLTAISVGFTLSGTATSGADFAALISPVVLDANVTTKDFYISTIDDVLPESSETVTLTLVTGTGYTLGTNKVATVTIADNDLPTVTLATIRHAAEGATPVTGIVRVTRTGSTTTALSVPFTLSGTASTVAGTDYTLSPSASPITIAIGATTADLIITPVNNAVAAGDKTVIVTLATGSFNPGAPNSATVTIADDERPTISIVATDDTATEAGLTTATFTVTRSAASATALTVPYTVSGSATAGIDYVALSGSVTLPAGQNSATVVVTPRDDAEIETAESITLALKTGSGYVVDAAAASATAMLSSDDLPAPIIGYQTLNGNTTVIVGTIPQGLEISGFLATTSTSGVVVEPTNSPLTFSANVSGPSGVYSAAVSLRYTGPNGKLGPIAGYSIPLNNGSPGGGQGGTTGSTTGITPLPPQVTIAVNPSSLTGEKTATVDGVEWNFSNKTNVLFDVSINAPIGSISNAMISMSNGESFPISGSGTISVPVAKDGLYVFSASAMASQDGHFAIGYAKKDLRVCVDRQVPSIKLYLPKKYWTGTNEEPLLNGTALNGNSETGIGGNVEIRKLRNLSFYNQATFSPTGAVGDSAVKAAALDLSGIRAVQYHKINSGTPSAVNYKLNLIGADKWAKDQILEVTGFELLNNGSWTTTATIEDRCGNIFGGSLLVGGIVEKAFPFSDPPRTDILYSINSPIRFIGPKEIWGDSYDIYQGSVAEDNLIINKLLPNEVSLPPPTYNSTGNETPGTATVNYVYMSWYGNKSQVYNRKYESSASSWVYPQGGTNVLLSAMAWPLNGNFPYEAQKPSFRDVGVSNYPNDSIFHGIRVGSVITSAIPSVGGFAKITPNSNDNRQSTSDNFPAPTAVGTADLSSLPGDKGLVYIRPIDAGSDSNERRFQPAIINFDQSWKTVRTNQKFRIKDKAITAIKSTFGSIYAYSQGREGSLGDGGYHSMLEDPTMPGAIISQNGQGIICVGTELYDGQLYTGLNDFFYALSDGSYQSGVSNSVSGWFTGVACTPDIAAVGTTAAIGVSTRFFDRSFKRSDFKETDKTYFRFIRKSDNKDCTEFLLSNAGDYTNLSDQFRDKIVIVEQKVNDMSGVNLKVRIGPDVEPGLYHLDIKCGTIHAYSDGLSQAFAGTNGAHRMKEAFRVVDLQWCRPSPVLSDSIPTITGTVPLSIPTPGIQFNSTPSAFIGADNRVSLTVSGVVRDPLADCEAGPSNVYGSLSLAIDGVPAGQIAVTEAADGAASILKPFPRKGTFTHPISFPAKAGIHSVQISTAKNDAGYSTSTTLLVSVQSRIAPIPGAAGSSEIVGKMALSIDRLDAQHLRLWWGTTSPPSDAVVLTVDALNAKKYKGISGSLSFEINATWPVANATVAATFPMDVTIGWPGSTPAQGRSTWQMTETSVSSERFVGFQDVIIPATDGGGNGGLQTWTASVSGGAGTAPGSWVPTVARFKGMTAKEAGLWIAGSKQDTVEHDGWLYAAYDGRPILVGAIASANGGANLRWAYGAYTTIFKGYLSANLELEAGVTSASISLNYSPKVAIGIQGWEELDLVSGGSPGVGRFAHVSVATPIIVFDHSLLKIRPDGKVHVEGSVIDPLEAISGIEGLVVTVNDVVAELSPIAARTSPPLPGGQRRRFSADIPSTSSTQLIWAVARNAVGGQGFDRVLMGNDAFTPDWPGSRSRSRVSRYRFGAYETNKALIGKNWKISIQSGETPSGHPIELVQADDLSLVTKPLVVTRKNERLIFSDVLAAMSAKTEIVVLTVPDLDTDVYVMVDAPAQERLQWNPDPTRWESTATGWRCRIEQAGLEIAPTDVPVAMMSSGSDITTVQIAAKARNLRSGDAIVGVTSVATDASVNQAFGAVPAVPNPNPNNKRKVLPPQTAVTVPNINVSVHLGVNQLSMDFANDSAGNPIVTVEDLGIYVVDSRSPYTPISVVDSRASSEAKKQQDAVAGTAGDPSNVPAIIACGHVFIADLVKGLDLFDAKLQEFLRKHDLAIVGSVRLPDEAGKIQVTVWIRVKSGQGVAWAEIAAEGKGLFMIRSGTDEDDEQLLTPKAREMMAFMKQHPTGPSGKDRTKVEQKRYDELRSGLQKELIDARWDTVQKTLASKTPQLEVLDCRYNEESLEKDIYSSLNSSADFSDTRSPFLDAYKSLRLVAVRSGQGSSGYRYAIYPFQGADRPASHRDSSELNANPQDTSQSPRVFFGKSQPGSLANLASRAIAAKGIVVSIHGFNNGNGRDGDEGAGFRIGDTGGGEKEPHRSFSNYWPVLETIMRDQAVITATTPVIHVWWTCSLNRGFTILDTQLTEYPDGPFFNLDNADAHFTGTDKVAPFLLALSTEINSRTTTKVPITILAESLGNRVAVSAMDAIGRDLQSSRFTEVGLCPLRYLAIHPALRQIDLDSALVFDNSEETERRPPFSKAAGFKHPYPESPLVSELRIMNSSFKDDCRILLAHSPFDKAGLAFLAVQRDNPHIDGIDSSRPTGMLGRTGTGGAGNVGDPKYLRGDNQPNIFQIHVGGNGDPQGPGGVLAQDFWHVDLWGWTLPDQAYLSRSIYGNNLPESSISGDERNHDNHLWVFPSPTIGPGLKVSSVVSVPPWNQITIRQQAIDRAWTNPRKLIANGQLKANALP